MKKSKLSPDFPLDKTREKRQQGRLPAAAHRSRQSQQRDVIEKEMGAADTRPSSVDENVSGEMTDESAHTNAEMKQPEFHDSEVPPPPQLRRARSKTDLRKKVKDKNTGIKHRDASGRKHSPREK